MENTTAQQLNQPQKRHTAYKLRVGAIINAKQNIEAEKLKSITLEDKQVSRVNVIANVIDKYIQEGEKKFGSLTVDDSTGQIKIKAFGDDVESFFSKLNQGDTIMIVGLLRTWNNEIYITPEIIKKKETEYLLVRKLEVESEESKTVDKSVLFALKDKMISMIKDSEKDNGIEIASMITNLKEQPSIINQEIKKLLEEGTIYEPRPGRIRWLG